MKERIKTFFRGIYRRILYFLPKKICLNIDTIRGYHKLCDFKEPKYFGEKIQWLKLYGNLEKYTDLVDKYKVRNFVKNKIGEKYLIKLIGTYDSVDDIDYLKLPEKFVLKINTGSGYNIVVQDKNKLKCSSINKKLKKWMKEDYAKIKKEPQYKKVEKKILCEEYISDSNNELLDYKFFCFNGEPKFLKVDYDRFSEHKVNFYDLNWNLLKMREGNYPNKYNNLKKPENFNEMVEVAKKLSAEFDFVRVDLYDVDGKIYFGELTFTPASGLNPFKPIEKDLKIAQLIKLSKLKNILYMGSVGEKSGRLDGVTVKSKNLLEFLKKQSIRLKFIDVDNYKKRFFTIIFNFLKEYNKCDSIVICSSSPGASIILRYLYWIKSKKKIYYFVCGGILDEYISDRKFNIKWYKKIYKLYVESDSLEKALKDLGLKQVKKLPNFRKANVFFKQPSTVSENSLKFVFFGRVQKEKGVEDAIQLIKDLTKEKYDVSLDIYGQATEEYKARLKSVLDKINNIEYKGAIIPDGKKEYEILHNYDVFIFPTHYYEEGLPGALIDSYISGLAVLASNWKYANEYIENNSNGLIYKFNDTESMFINAKKLINSNQTFKFKNRSIELSKHYLIDNVLKEFKEELIV